MKLERIYLLLGCEKQYFCVQGQTGSPITNQSIIFSCSRCRGSHLSIPDEVYWRDLEQQSRAQR